jgi:hypothetical protein
MSVRLVKSILKVKFGEEDKWAGVPFKRCRVEDHYKKFEVPEYDEGVAVASLVPLGMIGDAFFFKKDPLHFYITKMGRKTPNGEEVRIIATLFMEKCLATD